MSPEQRATVDAARFRAYLNGTGRTMAGFDQFQMFGRAVAAVSASLPLRVTEEHTHTAGDIEAISREATAQPCYAADLSRMLLDALRANTETQEEVACTALFNHLFGIPGFHAMRARNMTGGRLYRASRLLAEALCEEGRAHRAAARAEGAASWNVTGSAASLIVTPIYRAAE